MKEITFTFTDGSSYTIRPDRQGDTIYGVTTHDIMFRMNKHFNYTNVHENLRIQFILGEIEKNKISIL